MLNPIKKYDAPTPATITLDGLLSEAVMIDDAETRKAVLKAIIQTTNVCHGIVQARIDYKAEQERKSRVYYRG
tara:strand:+ start:455 stop:673 length:219 start_codon:yes stop_codon:yes gene_type:complete